MIKRWSQSYPYLAVAQHFGIRYSDVLCAVECLEQGEQAADYALAGIIPDRHARAAIRDAFAIEQVRRAHA